MNVLLYGPTGFVGKHLKARLIRDGHTVIDGTRDTCLVPELFDDTPVDVLVNAAGEITHPHLMYAANVALVEKLLRFARDAKISKVIHIGSSSEYGAISAPRREDMNCVPTDLYSATKVAATALCQGFARQYGVDVVVARPFSLYGPGDTPRKLIPRLIRSMRDSSAAVTLKMAPLHDWTYIDDFVQGLVTLMYAPSDLTRGDIVNFGTGESSTNAQVMVALQSVSENMATFANWMESTIIESDWVANPDRARERYGWTAQTSLEEGLRKTLALS